MLTSSQIQAFCIKLLYPLGYYDRKLIKRHHIDNTIESHVSLIFRCKHDHNGVFSLPHPIQSLRLLKQNDVKIVYVTVKDVFDIAYAIEKLIARNNKITSLSFEGHGNSSSVSFGKTPEDSLSLKRKHELEILRCSLNKLEKDAILNLDSCATGYIDLEGNTSLAQAVAEIANGRLVISARKDILGFFANKKIKNKVLVYKFRDIKTYTQNEYINSITSFLFLWIHLLTGNKCFLEDVTVYNKAIKADRPPK